MDAVLKELDEVKAQKEKLEEECRVKADLYESLRKAHNEHVAKFQEAKLQAEKQAQDLRAKSEELSEINQLYKDLKSSSHEKERSLRHLNSANEKLRADYGTKFQKLEGENKELALALDEATETIQGLEWKVCTGNEEIEGLKRLLSSTERKLLETTENKQTSNDMKQRDDVIVKLEEEQSDLQEQLKWKNEQFQHLEEAHERLQDNFRSSEAEWEREKSVLLAEICSLQANLDSQTRISESLQTQLRMCNQALAHEESMRKMLEVEVSEYKLRFENVFAECRDAKSKIEKLTLKRDEEVAKLRNSLATKDSLSREMEYKIVHLEQENQDIRASLREFQEAQISNAGSTCSLKKLQKKIQSLEQLHKKCSVNLKEKEVEWSAQIEKVTGDMNGYLSELKVTSEQLQELQKELESCHCLLEVLNEEIYLVTLVLKSEFSVAYSQLFIELSKMELCNKESEEKILLLTEQLEEQVQQLENAQKQDSRDGSNALGKVSFELAQKINEVEEAELELQKWKFMAEYLNIHLEACLDACKRENESLLHIVKEQNEKTGDLQQQIVLLESIVAERTEEMEALKHEKEHYIQITEDKTSIIENLLNEITSLRKESAKRELESAILVGLDARKVFEQERESLLWVIEERDQRIEDLQEQAKSLEEDITNAIISSEEKQIEIDVLSGALNKAHNQVKLEIEEKNEKLVKLEMEIHDLREKLKLKDESLFHSYQHVEQLEGLLKGSKLEREKLMDEFENEKRHLESLLKKLEFQKEALLDDIMKLPSDREDLLTQMEKICDSISEFSCKDVELMGTLEKILQKSESEKEIVNATCSPSRKEIEETTKVRSPLVELNK